MIIETSRRGTLLIVNGRALEPWPEQKLRQWIASIESQGAGLDRRALQLIGHEVYATCVADAVDGYTALPRTLTFVSDDESSTLPFELANLPSFATLYGVDQPHTPLVDRVTVLRAFAPPRERSVFGDIGQIRVRFLTDEADSTLSGHRVRQQGAILRCHEALGVVEPTELTKGDAPIVHALAHGSIDRGGDFVVHFGQRNLTSVEFADLLVPPDGPVPRLALLMICNSASSESSDNLARALLDRGVRMVIAPRHDVDGGDTDTFVRSFYEALVAGHDLGTCVRRGRRDLRATSMVPTHHAVIGAYVGCTDLSTGVVPSARRVRSSQSEGDRALPFEAEPFSSSEERGEILVRVNAANGLLDPSLRATPCVGRGAELDLLRGWLNASESLGVVLVSGEHGTGKTRLGWEAVDQARGMGWTAGFLQSVAIQHSPEAVISAVASSTHAHDTLIVVDRAELHSVFVDRLLTRQVPGLRRLRVVLLVTRSPGVPEPRDWFVSLLRRPESVRFDLDLDSPELAFAVFVAHRELVAGDEARWSPTAPFARALEAAIAGAAVPDKTPEPLAALGAAVVDYWFDRLGLRPPEYRPLELALATVIALGSPALSELDRLLPLAGFADVNLVDRLVGIEEGVEVVCAQPREAQLAIVITALGASPDLLEGWVDAALESDRPEGQESLMSLIGDLLRLGGSAEALCLEKVANRIPTLMDRALKEASLVGPFAAMAAATESWPESTVASLLGDVPVPFRTGLHPIVIAAVGLAAPRLHSSVERSLSSVRPDRFTRLLSPDHPQSIEDLLSSLINYSGYCRQIYMPGLAVEVLSKAFVAFRNASKTSPIDAWLLLSCRLMSEGLATGQLDGVNEIRRWTESVDVSLASERVRWRLDHTAARVLIAVGDYASALERAKGATTRAEDEFGDSSQEWLASSHVLGVCLCRLGLVGQALEQLAAVHEARRRLLGDGAGETLTTAHEVGVCLLRLGRPTDALALLEVVYEGRLKQSGVDGRSTLATAYQIGVCNRALGDVQGALERLTAVYEIELRVLGRGHPSVMTTAHEVGVCLRELGRVDEALGRFEAVYEARVRSLGVEHPATLATAHMIGVCLRDLGGVIEAIDRLANVQRVLRRVLGEEHSETLVTAYEVGVCLRELGRLDDALGWFEAVYGARVRVSGVEHPETLAAAYMVGLCLRELGRVEEALKPFRALHSSRVRVSGVEHPETLAAAHMVGVCLMLLGRVGEALERFEAVHGARVGVLGEEHSETLVTAYEVGVCLRELGRLDDALGWFEAVYGARVRVSGVEHPETLAAAHMVGVCLMLLGRVGEALERFEAVHGARVGVLGEEHSETLVTAYEVGVCLRELGRLDDALGWFEAVYGARVRVSGVEHPETLAAAYMVGLCLRELGRVEEALKPFRALHSSRVRVSGVEHPETLAAAHMVGVCLMLLGRVGEALERFEAVHGARVGVLGEEHSETLVTAYEVGVCLRELGRLDDALGWFEAVYGARVRVSGVEHPETLAAAYMLQLCQRETGER